jgi:hypothetical protein
MIYEFNWVREYRNRQHRPTDGGTVDYETYRANAAAALRILPTLSLEYWNPDEQPITVAGSVFDVDSFGEWILKWTSYYYGPQHEAMRVAGRFYELAVHLNLKLDRAYTVLVLDSAVYETDRRILDDFIQSGDGLWYRFESLVYKCSKYMHADRGEGYSKVVEGDEAAVEFVSAMFDSEKKWPTTERLMLKIAQWKEGFDLSCEDVLRRSYFGEEGVRIGYI